MKIIDERSYKGGIDFLKVKQKYEEIKEILEGVKSLRHDKRPNEIQTAFNGRGWETEKKFRNNKLDAFKDRIAINIEASHVVHIDTDVRDFSLLYRLGEVEVGVLILDMSRLKEKHNFDTVCRTKIEQYKEDILVPLVVFACDDNEIL